MKRLEELNINPIKCEHKQGTEKLKALHYSANEVIFKYHKRYINAVIAAKIYKAFITIGKDIKDLEVPDSAKAKQRELLDILRGYCKIISGYKPDDNNYEFAASKTMQFALSQYLYDKDKGKLKDPLQVLKHLNNIKEIREEWSKYPITNKKALCTANAELLEMINEYYKLTDTRF